MNKFFVFLFLIKGYTLISNNYEMFFVELIPVTANRQLFTLQLYLKYKKK